MKTHIAIMLGGFLATAAVGSTQGQTLVPPDMSTNTVDTNTVNQPTNTFENTNTFETNTNTVGNNNNRNNGNHDARWLSQAAESDLRDIDEGNLAQTNSSDPDVQAYGLLLVSNHVASYQQIVDLAATNNASIPSNLNRGDQKTLDRLASRNGSAFDAAFLNQSIRDHLRDSHSYEIEALNGSNPDTRAFARTQLPVLADELATALQLRENFGFNSGFARIRP